MKHQRNILIAALLVAGASSAFSQSGLTRAQVKAELQEAIQNGEIQFGDRSETLREIYPSRYPAKVQQPGKTRAEVRAELAEAIRTGDIQGNGDRSEPLNVLYPHRYPQDASTQAAAKPLS
jgi:hypothetical protein